MTTPIETPIAWFLNHLPHARRALDKRPRVAEALDGIIARHDLGFANGIEYLIAVACPQLLLASRRARALGWQRLPPQVRSFDRGIAMLIERIGSVLLELGFDEDLGERLTSLFARQGFNPFPTAASVGIWRP